MLILTLNFNINHPIIGLHILIGGGVTGETTPLSAVSDPTKRASSSQQPNDWLNLKHI